MGTYIWAIMHNGIIVIRYIIGVHRQVIEVIFASIIYIISETEIHSKNFVQFYSLNCTVSVVICPWCYGFLDFQITYKSLRSIRSFHFEVIYFANINLYPLNSWT